jgi:hypothetical protein
MNKEFEIADNKLIIPDYRSIEIYSITKDCTSDSLWIHYWSHQNELVRHANSILIPKQYSSKSTILTIFGMIEKCDTNTWLYNLKISSWIKSLKALGLMSNEILLYCKLNNYETTYNE